MGDELVYLEGMRWLRDYKFYHRLLRYFNPLVGDYWIGLHAEDGYTTASPPADRLIACAYPILRRMRFDQVRFVVHSAGGAGALARVGIYRDNGDFYPGELIQDFGDFDVSTSGGKYATIDLTLDRGLYWIAYNNNDGSAAYRIYRALLVPRLSTPGAIEYPRHAYEVTQAYGALPSTFPAGGSTTSWGLLCKLRIAEILE